MVELYKMFLFKERSLYTSLNKLREEDKLFHGYCWIPTTEKPVVDNKLAEIKEKNPNVELPRFLEVKDHDRKPPSFFRTNEFVWAF